MKEVWLVFEERVMKILDWRTDEVLWWMKIVGGSVTHEDALSAAHRCVKARGYKLVDSENS